MQEFGSDEPLCMASQQGGQFMAVQPKLKLPRDEGGLEKLRNALIEGSPKALEPTSGALHRLPME
eukprot:1960141-Amphidinium_carterae.1